MPEYCVTFLHIPEGATDETPDDPVFHTHVNNALDVLAVEDALRDALAQNVSLKRANAIALRTVMVIQPEVIEGMDALRVAAHGHAPPAPVHPTDGHLH